MMPPIYDVIQIGYGPVSAALALMLGRQGRRVMVCERWTSRYSLPRAVCIDHELYRVLAANGMAATLPHVTHGGPKYQWFNADWQELLVFDWSKDSISGGPEVNFVHQPTLEQAIDQAVQQQPSVDILLGWEALLMEQDDALAHVTLRHIETGEERHISAHYVIGCDGANSVVRQAIGGDREDRGFEADWLVIDVLLKPGITIEKLGIPGAGQYCNPVRPTTIVPAGIREGRIFRRWEFMRLPGESVESLEQEDRVWELLAPWAGPGDIELVRHKVYNFRSLIAEHWRDRRLLIAGDAAHVMPPFMGQGMCSGIRDSWNLAWKLGLVLDGRADDALLDTYQTERLPHVSQITDLSIYLGKVICIPDAEAAARRDHAFMDGTAEAPPPFPHLTDGIIHRRSDGEPQAGAGMLSPHSRLEQDGVAQRQDDMMGPGFLVVTRGTQVPAGVDGVTRSALEAIGTKFLRLGTGAARDLDGRLDAFLDAQGWIAMVVRPDFYVYGGTAALGALPGLLADLISDLRRFGLSAATAAPSSMAVKEIDHEARAI